jgi:NADH-quinone oxidoreductase subunit C
MGSAAHGRVRVTRMNTDELLAAVDARFGAAILARHAHAGDATIVIGREDLLATCAALRDDPAFGFTLLVDVTAVDFLGRQPRFEVVYHFYALAHGHRLRVKVAVGDPDPTVPSVTSLWKAANWLEREVWDMFGIRFTAHPDLRRILMYPEFVGHPLRKDYPVSKRQPLVPERDPIATPWGRR